MALSKLLNGIFGSSPIRTGNTVDRPDKRYALVGPAELWNQKRKFQFDFLRKAGLERGDHVLDIGCGALRGGIPLIDYLDEGHYCGLESRFSVLEEGFRELTENNLSSKKPILIGTKSMEAININEKFDFVWSFSVLIHMTDEIAGICIRFAADHLKKDGVFFANVNIGDRPDGHWQSFPIVWRPIAFYEGLASANGLRVEDLGSLKSVGHDFDGAATEDFQRMLKFSFA